MNAWRAIAKKHPELGGDVYATARGTVTLPFAYTFKFLFYDGGCWLLHEVVLKSHAFLVGLAVIQEETIRNIIIAGIAVAIITLILLANVVASALVLVMLVLVDINVLGFMVRCGRVL